MEKIIGAINVLNLITLEWYEYDLTDPSNTVFSDNKHFEDILSRIGGNKISYCSITGHAGSGKSTLIRAYLDRMKETYNMYVYAKDIAHMHKSGGYSYAYHYINAAIANKLAKLITTILNKKHKHKDSKTLVILDGVSFDGMVDVPNVKLEPRIYTKKQFIKLICNSERRSILEIYKNIKIDQIGDSNKNISLLEYVNTFDETYIYRKLLNALIDNKVDKYPIEIQWSGIKINKQNILDAVKTNSSRIPPDIQTYINDSIGKKRRITYFYTLL